MNEQVVKKVYLETGSPFQGRMLAKVQAFLHSCGLDYDPAIGFTAVLSEDGDIVATGSLDGATVKCVAVSSAHQGEDLTAQIMTALFSEAARQGHSHLMLYTKPQNQYLFQSFGFHPVIRTADCLLMENRRGGLSAFLDGLTKPADQQKPVGCIVANCNPFTKGHRYLIETAASECAWVHLFILSEDKSAFSAQQRMAMAVEGCRDLPNVLIHPTGPYMVSSSTFPHYFIKDKFRTDDIHCELDVRLFGEKIAPALHITRRYVGTEPFCAVTRAYNARMKQLLPEYGVELIEVERKTEGGVFISASHVRDLLLKDQTNELKKLLPESTLKMITL